MRLILQSMLKRLLIHRRFDPDNHISDLASVDAAGRGSSFSSSRLAGLFEAFDRSLRRADPSDELILRDVLSDAQLTDHGSALEHYVLRGKPQRINIIGHKNAFYLQIPGL